MPSATVNDFFQALTVESLSKDELEQVYGGLSNFVDVFDANNMIRSCLLNNIYPSSVKADLISNIVLDCKHTRRFLETLIEFNLLGSFIDSREFFLKKLRKVLGKIRIEVTTINIGQTEKLNIIRENLKSIWGDNLELSFNEDPTIIGGLILQVEDKFFDGSLNGKISKFKNLNLKGEF